MRWGRTFTLLFLFAGLGSAMVGTAPPAHACTCLPTSNGDLIRGAEAAFVGTAIAVDDPEGGGEMISSGRTVITTYRVERVLKGGLGPTVDVASAAEGATCGVGGQVGVRLGLALSRGDDAQWRASLCTRLDLDDLPAGPGPPDTGSGGGGGNDPELLVVGGLVALAALGAAYVGSRHRP